MSTDSWNRKGLDEKPLQVQIAPLFCYACSRNFTDLDSFKNHEHSKAEKDGDNWFDIEIKTEFDDLEQEEEEDLADWSPSVLEDSNLFAQLDTTITTTTTSTIKTNTSPLKSRNQNNSSEDRNISKCLKSPDEIKILCYICHTRFMSLQKFLNHLKSPPTTITETTSHTWNFEKESPQVNNNNNRINNSSKTNCISHDDDDDDYSSNHIFPSPLPHQQEEKEDSDENDNDNDNMEIRNEEEQGEDPLKLNDDATDCPHCTKSFRKPAHLATHMRIFHSRAIEVQLNSDSNQSDPEYQNQNQNQEEPDNDLYTKKVNPIKRRRRRNQYQNVESEKVKHLQCPHCLHVFTSPKDVKRHLDRMKRLHQDCPICGESFELTCLFRKHLKEAHLEKITEENETERISGREFKCPFPGCGRFFARAYTLKAHVNIHTGAKPYECDEPGCNKSFRRPGDLYIHRLHHRSTRPFPCPHDGCDKAFFTKKDLQRHSTSHMSEKPFKCDFIGPQSKPCSRSFRNQSELNIHKNKHTGTIIFTCPESTCRQVYREWRGLKAHADNKHPSLSGSFSKSTVMSISTSDERENNNFSMNEEDSTSRMTMESMEIEINEDAEWLPNENLNENSNDNNNEEKPRRFKCPHPGCTSAFNHKKTAERHFTIHMPEKPFKCDFLLPDTGLLCTRRFRVKSELNDHMNKHTGEIIYTCDRPDCDKTFREKRLLRYHIKNHDAVRKISEPKDENANSGQDSNSTQIQTPIERIKNFKCSVENCEAAFYLRKSLNRHLITHMKDKPFKCTFILEDSGEPCGRQFRGSDELKNHENKHTREIRFDCPHENCSKVYYDKLALRSHLKKIHPTPKQLEAMRAKAEREKEEGGGEKERQFRCPTCNKGFFTNRERNRHTTVHLPEKPFKCDYLNPETGLLCDRAFRIKSELNLHTNLHTKERVFKCPHSDDSGPCSAIFWERRVLKEHIRKKHSDEDGGGGGEEQNTRGGNIQKSFKCYVGDCNGKAFAYSSALKYHQSKSHCGIKTPGFICELCGKTLSNSTNLKNHLKVIHEREKNYLCGECGVGFYSQGIFKRHVIFQHSKETPFQCENCSRQFRFQYELTKHIAKVHNGTGEREKLRNWKCDWNNGECDKSFFTKNALRRHTFVHTGERPFQCPVIGCTVAYPDRRPWKAHIQKAHPDYVPDPVDPVSTS